MGTLRTGKVRFLSDLSSKEYYHSISKARFMVAAIGERVRMFIIIYYFLICLFIFIFFIFIFFPPFILMSSMCNFPYTFPLLPSSIVHHASCIILFNTHTFTYTHSLTHSHTLSLTHTHTLTLTHTGILHIPSHIIRSRGTHRPGTSGNFG